MTAPPRCGKHRFYSELEATRALLDAWSSRSPRRRERRVYLCPTCRTSAQGPVWHLTSMPAADADRATDTAATVHVDARPSELDVWWALAAGITMTELLDAAPAHDRDRVQQVALRLVGAHLDLLDYARAIHQGIVDHLDRAAIVPGAWLRADYAQLAVENHAMRRYLFLLFDGHDARAAALAWRDVKPCRDRHHSTHPKDAA